jgi:hypothetical protein
MPCDLLGFDSNVHVHARTATTLEILPPPGLVVSNAPFPYAMRKGDVAVDEKGHAPFSSVHV